MKYVRFELNPGAARYGVVDGDMVYETPALGVNARGAAHPRDSVKLLVPCAPSKIVCVGRNYAAHAKELGNEVPNEPLIFLKPPSSLNAHQSPIVYPAISENVNFEGEIGLIIGKRARNIAAADAMNYIFGFTVVNDVTARDLQKKDGQFTRGKGFDTFCCVGPYAVPKEDVDIESLAVRTYLNDEMKQNGSIDQLIFPLGAIMEFVTRFMTLEPGDLIATGTPEGVGPVQPGDRVRVEIPGVGTLENPVEAEERTYENICRFSRPQ